MTKAKIPNTLNLSPAEREERLDAHSTLAGAGGGENATAFVDAALFGGLPNEYEAQCAKLNQLWHIAVVLNYAEVDVASTPSAKRAIRLQGLRVDGAASMLREMMFGDADDGYPRLPRNLKEAAALVDVIEFDEREMLDENYQSPYPGDMARAALYKAVRRLCKQLAMRASAPTKTAERGIEVKKAVKAGPKRSARSTSVRKEAA